MAQLHPVYDKNNLTPSQIRKAKIPGLFYDKKGTTDKRHWYISNGDKKSRKMYYDQAISVCLKNKADNNATPTQYILFDAVYQSYLNELEQNVGESSYVTYEGKLRNNVYPYFKGKIITQITLKDIDDWKQALSKQLSSINEMNRLLNHFRRIIIHGKIRYEIKTDINEKATNISNIVSKISYKEKLNMIEKVKFWTKEQYERFLNNINDLENYLLFSLIYYCTLRKGEVLALRWKSIKDKQIYILNNCSYKIKKDRNIIQKKNKRKYKLNNPKAKNSIRKIKIPSFVYELLIKYKSQRDIYENYKDDWFIFGEDRPLPQNKINDLMTTYQYGLNLPHLTPHGLKHSSVAYLIHLGFTPFQIAERTGNTEDTIKRVYAHLFPSAIDDIVKKIEENSNTNYSKFL